MAVFTKKLESPDGDVSLHGMVYPDQSGEKMMYAQEELVVNGDSNPMMGHHVELICGGVGIVVHVDRVDELVLALQAARDAMASTVK